MANRVNTPSHLRAHDDAAHEQEHAKGQSHARATSTPQHADHLDGQHREPGHQIEVELDEPVEAVLGLTRRRARHGATGISATLAA